ncbi:MAG TPA: response regulator [Candidatus Eisenbacteria bacterium]|nr:response regulator [Candidatus Eisenbacteria bacterium]
MSKKILIVEDNEDSRELLAHILRSQGHRVIEASSSKEGIESAIRENPDLIFMDLGLPDVDGLKTTAALGQNPATSHIPVVAVTAWFYVMWKDKATQAGVAEYLEKPALPAMLRDAVDRFTRKTVSQ